MARVLLFATTTGYQVRAFDAAAAELGVELQVASDRCDQLEDPWRDRAIPVRFYQQEASVAAVLAAHRATPFDGILAVGDRPAALAALAARGVGLRWHSPEGTEISRNKLRTRERLQEAGLPVPTFGVARSEADLAGWTESGPVVVKPLVLSGSRGVIRADTPAALRTAWSRVRRLLDQPDVQSLRDPAASEVLVEAFIPGREFAIEGLLTAGRLSVVTIFDKPDPLYGPFFEETLYVTPSRATPQVQRVMTTTVDAACRAIGLDHGPIHAECRVNDQGVFILEIAARSIGGICARAIRLAGPGHKHASLESLLLRHAIGERVERWTRERKASGVMMVPIPGPGVLREVGGVNQARGVAGIDDVTITAKADQVLLPLPEGATYLGFIFASASTPSEVEAALRTAHACLDVKMERAIPVI